jgi:SWI/SNF-related matrix-associated actin-dependent regulator 1 of chromatin subfamily A
MGAGKTVIMSVVANHLKWRSVLIVCIASVKANWRSEWRRFNLMAHNRETTVACAEGSLWPDTDVVIVNFDILDRFRTEFKINPEDGELVMIRDGRIDARKWDAVIVDECHKIKGRAAGRTHAVIGYKKRGKQLIAPIAADNKIAMSGTPLVNRPAEMWPALNWLWPTSFDNFYPYGIRYCDGAKKGFGKSWDFKGDSNLEELNVRARLLGMMARPKSLTHADLPPKRRKIIEFDLGNLESLVKLERNQYASVAAAQTDLSLRAEAALVMQDDSAWRSAMKDLKSKVFSNISELTKAREAVANAMMPDVLKHLEALVADGHKIIVFAWHQDVVERIAKNFEGCPMIHGGVQTADRPALMNRFQTDDSCRVIVGSIGAMGTGVTLTAADTIVFVELHWVPGDLLQAEDRAHRPGQTQSLEVQYLVAAGSISAAMAERVIEKIEVIERAVGPVQMKLAELPISIDANDVPTTHGTVEEPDMFRRKDVPLTVREKIERIARGLTKRRPDPVVHMVACRIAGVQNWTPEQHAFAEKLAGTFREEDL